MIAACDTCGAPSGVTREDLERLERQRPVPEDPKVRWQVYAVCGACVDREREERSSMPLGQDNGEGGPVDASRSSSPFTPKTWHEWREWAEALVSTHDPYQVADSLADAVEQLHRFGAALAILADPESWAGDPLKHATALYGHDTPYELARRTLGLDDA